MGPEAADASGVRVGRLVRVLMVQTVGGHPEDRAALERERPAQGEKILEDLGRLEAAVGVQPVVAHADAEADGSPVQNGGDEKNRQEEQKDRSDVLCVNQDKNEAGRPADLGIPRCFGRGGGVVQGGSLRTKNLLRYHLPETASVRVL